MTLSYFSISHFEGDPDTLLDIKRSGIQSIQSVYSREQIQNWLSYIDSDNHAKNLCLNKDVFVAYCQDVVAGFCAVSYDREDPDMTLACIDNIFVDKSYQNKGIGKALVERVMNDFKDNAVANAPIVVVDIRASLNALGFYEQFGFKPIGNSMSRAGFPIKLMRQTIITQ